MYIMNGIAYAAEKRENIEIKSVKALDDMILLVTFSTEEQRVFDASYLLEYPAFTPLKDEEVFKSTKVEYGVVCGVMERLILLQKRCMKKVMNMNLLYFSF